MNTSKVIRIIDSIGVNTFVTYFKQFSDLHNGHITKDELTEYFIANEEKWVKRSVVTKINSALRIFSLGRELEAISHILYVKNTGNIPNGIEIKKQAEKIKSILETSGFLSPEEISHSVSENYFSEGKSKTVSVNKYERNIRARMKCIEYYGLNCKVCECNFEEMFGSIGEDFIHVHHKIELASIGKEYKLDPIKDLIPLCPNCHSMIHRRKPAYSIEELRKIRKLCK
jgi:5-methylcytosine-specific restriction protein A